MYTLYISVEQIAGEAGHVEIVDILRNSADSGIMDIEHMHENDGRLTSRMSFYELLLGSI